jgi:hypothetical protein
MMAKTDRCFLCVAMAIAMIAAAAWAVDSGPGAAKQAPADFYVATNGNDGWSGRLAEPNAAKTDGPFATMARARDGVRETRKREDGLKKDIVVLIRGGVYRLAAPIAFSSEDSGTSAHSVTYAAYPGERPVLSGGQVIGGWKRGEGKLWTASVTKAPAEAGTTNMKTPAEAGTTNVKTPAEAGTTNLRTPADAGATNVKTPADAGTTNAPFRQLFVNGQRRVRARTPNEGFYRIVRAAPKERQTFTYRQGDFRQWSNMGDVEIVLFYDWDIGRMKGPTLDEATSTVRFPRPIGNLGLPFTVFNNFDPHQRYYLENAPEMLDAPGEWYLDRKAGVVTYWPMEGETLEKAQVVAPRLEWLLVAKGTPQAPIRRLNLRGLTFEHTDWPLPDEGFGGVQAGTYGSSGSWNRLPAAVEFTGAIQCRFEGNRIRHAGAAALNFEQGCVESVIGGNHICDAGANGIQLGETAAKPRDPADVSRTNEIANNVIHDCGQDYPGSVGVWIGHTDHSVVAHNLIYNLPYTGISVGWTWNPTPTVAKDNQIEYNHIHHVMQVLADGGGIYTLGFQPGMAIRGNWIHDVAPTHGRAPSNGMFIDEGSKGFLVEENVLYNTPDGAFRFNQSQQDWHTFRNNSTDVAPGAPSFPKEKAAKAGLDEEVRKTGIVEE